MPPRVCPAAECKAISRAAIPCRILSTAPRSITYLLARGEQLEWHDVLPHPERRIRLTVTSTEDAGARTPLLTLAPLDDTDCLCQFITGQYLMLEGTAWLARAYSIGSAPRPDGTIKLQIRRRTRAASPDGSSIKPSDKTIRPQLPRTRQSGALKQALSWLVHRPAKSEPIRHARSSSTA